MNANDQEQGVCTLGLPEWVDRIPSTNSELIHRLTTASGIQPGHVLAARHQSAGRGRHTRIWHSSPGRDLTFSFLWPEQEMSRMVSIPMAVALAVTDLLDTYVIHAQTKWPNDVLVNEQKLCGILTETATHRNGSSFVVVGVGLNVNMTAEDTMAIDRPVTSMRMLTGTAYTVEAVLDRLLPLLNARLVQWSQGGFPALRSDWDARAIWTNQLVRLQTDITPLAGILRGYGDAGELLLETRDSLHSIWSAELMQRVHMRSDA